MELTTLKTFVNPVEAHILKSRLEDEGIQCHLFDENIVSIYPLYSLSVGGIKLNIQKSDLDDALKVLSEIEGTPLTDENNEIIRCPKCLSNEFYTGIVSVRGFKGILITIAVFLFSIFPFNFNSFYKCKKCGKIFTIKQ